MSKSVLVLVDDLFWRSKIESAIKSAEVKAVFAADPDLVNGEVIQSNLCLVIADLALRRPPFDWITHFKGNPATSSIPVIGFFEHIRKDLKEKGLSSGCDQVLARSAFSEKLADLVLEHALPGSVRTEADEVELPEE